LGNVDGIAHWVVHLTVDAVFGTVNMFNQDILILISVTENASLFL
jgi:hypothetical protein